MILKTLQGTKVLESSYKLSKSKNRKATLAVSHPMKWVKS